MLYCRAAEKIAQPENCPNLLFQAGSGIIPSALLTQLGVPLLPALLGGWLIYLVYSALVLSPLGEMFLRMKNGCRNAARRKSKQENEYRADEFTCSLGLGLALSQDFPDAATAERAASGMTW